MKTYFGYDLGDGETCISVYELQNGRLAIEQLQMPGMGSSGAAMPTLLAMDASGNGTVGPMTLRDRMIAQISDIDINFKVRPTELTKNEFAEFSRRVICFTECLFKSCSGVVARFSDYDRHEFVVAIGHPTTWTTEDVKLYLSIFEKAKCFANPASFYDRDDISVELMLKAESDAALMNLVNAKKDDSSDSAYDITINDIPSGGYVVVFDFGSSTTDVTVIRNDNGHIYTDGIVQGNCHLGARYIDRAIYVIITNEKLHKDIALRFREALKLPQNKNLEKLLIYHCRLAKETFFLTASELRKNNVYAPLSRTPGNFFELDDEFANDGYGIMGNAVGCPVKELGGKSWKEACREMFLEVAQGLEKDGSKPAIVFLTGGASRMDFVQEFAREMFEDTRIVYDTHPARCISHGLAYIPHKLEKAKAFLEDVRKYIATDLPTEIGSRIGDVVSPIASSMADEICDIALDEAKKWKRRDYYYLSTMESKIGERVETFSRSPRANAISAKAVSAFLGKKLVPAIKSDLDAICHKHGIRYAQYGIRDTLTDWSKEFDAKVNGGATGSGVADGIGDDVVGAIIKVIALAVAAIIAPIVLLITTGIVIPIVTWISVTVLSILTTSVAGIPIALAIVAVGMGYILIHGWDGVKAKFIANVKGYDLPQWVRNQISESDLKNKVNAQHDTAKNDISSALTTSDKFKKSLINALSKPIEEQLLHMADDIALRIRE